MDGELVAVISDLMLGENWRASFNTGRRSNGADDLRADGRDQHLGLCVDAQKWHHAPIAAAELDAGPEARGHGTRGTR